MLGENQGTVANPLPYYQTNFELSLSTNFGRTAPPSRWVGDAALRSSCLRVCVLDRPTLPLTILSLVASFDQIESDHVAKRTGQVDEGLCWNHVHPYPGSNY